MCIELSIEREPLFKTMRWRSEYVTLCSQNCGNTTYRKVIKTGMWPKIDILHTRNLVYVFKIERHRNFIFPRILYNNKHKPSRAFISTNKSELTIVKQSSQHVQKKF